ncbi:MAG: hypothetical protein MZV70_11355 [Desulfobacterales bacterium]|nr:hypothetical protein [Desulfobacterales bacterium]
MKSLGELLVRLAAKDLKPERAIELAIQYYEPILKEKFDDFPRRQKDLEQLLPMASRYQKLRSFLDDLALEPPASLADMSPDQRGAIPHPFHGPLCERIWSGPWCFILWATEGYFPSARSSQNEEGLEEERRLMYVAATRAKDHLILCYPGQETGYSWSSGYNASGRAVCLLSFRPFPKGCSSSAPWARQKEFRWPSVAAAAPHKVKEPPPESPAGPRAGDRVKHPAFGHGVISRLVDKEKVEVLFRDFGGSCCTWGIAS